MKTVLITGCSSGFGLETAKYFLSQGWNVIATMRTPKVDLFSKSDRLRLLPLDVTDAESIKRVVKEAGPIDVLVNNAGVGMLSAVEASSLDAARALFETNVFGTIAMIQAFLPQMRERKSGVIVNVTSSVTLRSLPLLALYSGSKAAVNGFTGSLALELKDHGIRAHLVLPGRSPETQFAANARGERLMLSEPYMPLAHKVMEHFQHSTAPVTYSKDVAEAVYFAVTEPNAPLRIPAGEDAKQEEAARIGEARAF